MLTNGGIIVQLSKNKLYQNKSMDIVIDTSAIIAVIVGEPERDKIVELTKGCTLIGPGPILWEVGNAFSAMLKRGRIKLEEAIRGIIIFESIPIRYVPVDLVNVIKLANKTGLYAYDIYFLDCAIKYKAPLLTLDKRLLQVAKNLKISVLEV